LWNLIQTAVNRFHSQFLAAVRLVVVADDFRRNEDDQLAFADIDVARAEQPADDVEVFQIRYAVELADIVAVPQAADDNGLLVADRKYRGGGAGVDNRLIVAGREADKPAHFWIHCQSDQAFGGNLGANVKLNAGLLEGRCSDRAALLRLRQLLVGDFL